MTDVIREKLLPRLDGIRPGHGTWMARCPVHNDHTASLSITPGRDQPALITCHAGCVTDDILAAIGLTWTDISAPRDPGDWLGADNWMPCSHTKVAEYEYRDQHNQLIFAVARCSEKGKTCQGFRQWRPDPTARSGKRWSLKRPDGSRVGDGLPYKLPNLLDAPDHLNRYIVEGEKDALRLWELGVPATCNAQGAGKWTQAHAAWFRRWDVIIVADRDAPGWRHAEQVASTIMDHARSIEIVRAWTGKDLSDHLTAGHTLAELVTIAHAKATPRIGADGNDIKEAA